MTTQPKIAIILAGGQGRRFGGCEKAWLRYQGLFFIEIILEKLQKQGMDKVYISANRELSRYQSLGYPVVSDDLSLPESPLRGIFSTWHIEKAEEVFIVPVDVPKQPEDLYSKLKKQLKQKPESLVIIAHTGEQSEPLFLLAKAEALIKIPIYLQSDKRSVQGWYQDFAISYADFSHQKKNFLNINTREDLNQLL